MSKTIKQSKAGQARPAPNMSKDGIISIGNTRRQSEVAFFHEMKALLEKYDVSIIVESGSNLDVYVGDYQVTTGFGEISAKDFS